MAPEVLTEKTNPGAGTAQTGRLTGRVLGEFTVRDKLAEGGGGEVYRAEQTSLHREAVIKVLLAEHVSLEANQRFLREARLASTLDHPYAAHVYASGMEPDGLLWIAMELVRGTTLDAVIKQQGPLSLARFVPLMERICEVVHSAHEQGIIHRDIKPSNVMVVSRAGRMLPKLLDLGIAKLRRAGEPAAAAPVDPAVNVAVPEPTHLTAHALPPIADDTPTGVVSDVASPSPAAGGRTGTWSATLLADEGFRTSHTRFIGSPHYMAPEQWAPSSEVDGRADIYALGVLTFQVLTGHHPFTGKSAIGLYKQHLTSPVPRLPDTLPAALNDVVAKAMAKRAEDRYADALDLAAALRAAAAQGGEELPTLPLLDDAVRAEVLARAPQPLAEALTAVEAARTGAQGLAACRQLTRTLITYLGTLALASRGRIGSGSEPEDPATQALLNALLERGLTPAEWLELAKRTCRPFRTHPEVHPLPELVGVFFRPDGSELPLEWAALTGGAPVQGETEARAAFERELPLVEKALRALAFLVSYELVVQRGDATERWMGCRRPHRLSLTLRGGALEDGEVGLATEDGALVLALSPLAVALAPSPGAPPELFWLSGPGRHGARLVAVPLGYERQDEAPFRWLREQVPGLRAVAGAAAEQDRPPFRGLAAFTASDAQDFFGREQEAQAFANRLRVQPLLAVVGPSGVGKSSFVQAGVLPLLPPEWRHLSLRPGNTPLLALAAALRQAEISVPELKPALERDVGALRAALQADVERTGRPLLLLVDQFEELITLCHDERERELFAQGLAELAAAGGSLRVVLTLRDDFLIRAQLPGLREQLSTGLQLLGTPGKDELLRILTEPLRRVGYAFDSEELPRRMVEEVASQSGALALLSFSATKLWELRDRAFKRLTRTAYDSLGGVGGALAHHAEATLAAMTEEERRLTREAFRHLVSSQGTRAVLSRQEMSEVLGGGPQTQGVVEKLIQSRLLVASEDAAIEDRVEVVHEALLSSWPRLVKWQRENAEGARLRDLLRSGARQWAERGRPRGLLWRGEALLDYRLWRSRFPGAITALEKEFADASLRDEARGQRIRRGLLAAAVLALLTGVVLLSRANARAHQQLLRLWQEQGRLALLDERPLQALAYLGRAYEEGERGPALRLLLSQAKRSADAALASVPVERRPQEVHFSPQGELFTATGERTVRLWRASDGEPVGVLEGHTGNVLASSFSADGAVLATAGDTTVRLWDVRSRKPLRVLEGHKDLVGAVQLSRDGARVASASDDKTVRLWDGATGALLHTLETEDLVSNVALSGDGRWVSASAGLLAMSTRSPEVRVWDARSGALVAKLVGHELPVRRAVFSPDGARLATASLDGTARLWELPSGKALKVLSGHVGAVQDCAFSPDGSKLATAGHDGTARLYDVATGAALALLAGHDAPLATVAFTPDGAALLSSSEDGTARLWDVAHGYELMRFEGHTDAVAAGELSPDGLRVATAGRDRTVRLFDARMRMHQHALTVDGRQSFARLSADGQRVIAAVEGKGLVQQPLTGGAPASALLPPGSAPSLPAYDLSESVVLVESADQRSALLVDARTGNERQRLVGHTGELTSLSLSDDGRLALTTSADQTARLWDARTGAALAVLAHEDKVHVGALSPDGRLAATGCRNENRVRVFDTATGQLLKTLEGNQLGVYGLAFRRDGQVLASGGADQTARTWDVRSGQPLAVLRGHRGFLNTVDWSPDGSMLVTSAMDGTARVWDAGSGAELMRLSAGEVVVSANFSRDGRSLLTAALDGRQLVWDMTRAEPGAALERFLRCRPPFELVGEQLQPRERTCPPDSATP